MVAKNKVHKQRKKSYQATKGNLKLFSFDKLGISSQQGGGGSDQIQTFL